MCATANSLLLHSGSERDEKFIFDLVSRQTSGHIRPGPGCHARLLQSVKIILTYAIGKGSLRRFRSRSFISAWASFALAAAKRSLAWASSAFASSSAVR